MKELCVVRMGTNKTHSPILDMLVLNISDLPCDIKIHIDSMLFIEKCVQDSSDWNMLHVYAWHIAECFGEIVYECIEWLKRKPNGMLQIHLRKSVYKYPIRLDLFIQDIKRVTPSVKYDTYDRVQKILNPVRAEDYSSWAETWTEIKHSQRCG